MTCGDTQSIYLVQTSLFFGKSDFDYDVLSEIRSLPFNCEKTDNELQKIETRPDYYLNPLISDPQIQHVKPFNRLSRFLFALFY